ncbi:MAG: exo-alpha-sialidase, partial [Lentisphaeria bacterium]|nr:exo-alpha-sialidase [Lentisphaeria bacterium]
MNCKPIKLNMNPGTKADTKFRFWQGCPTILRTKGGRIYAAWYSGGVGEPDPENYNLLICSDDDGWTWTKPIVTVESEP